MSRRMGTNTIGTREEWLAARVALLEREKELTRLSDQIAKERRALPWVPVEKSYSFETDEGSKSLRGLFGGRSQLLVNHIMMGPEWEEPCVGCSFSADHYDGSIGHLNAHDVTFIGVSRAPIERIQRYKERIGWRFPWVSCLDSEFNFDFGASFTDEQQRSGAEYNYRRIDDPGDELHAFSAFAREGDAVFHTYSAYHRGTDAMNPTWQFLDRAPKGREDSDHPDWPRRSYEYSEDSVLHEDPQGGKTR